MATGLENPWIAPEAFDINAVEPNDKVTSDSRIAKRWQEDIQNINPDIESGKINRAEGILRLLGVLGGTVADLAGAPLDFALNELGVNDAIAKQVKKLAETEKGQQLVKWSQENPEATKDILAGMDVASAFPGLKTVQKGVDKAARGSYTMVEGGTLGNAVHEVRKKFAEHKGLPEPKKANFYNTGPIMFVGDMLDGAVGGLADSVIPSRIAAARQSGFLGNARKEIKENLAAGSTNKAEQAAIAKRMLALQAGAGEPGMFTSTSPLGRSSFLETGINVAGPKSRWSRGVDWNQEGLDKVKGYLMRDGLDEQAADRVIADFKQNVFSNQGGNNLSKFAEFLNPSKEGMFVDVWNPNTGQSFRELGIKPMPQAAGTTLNKIFTPETWKKIPDEIKNDEFLLAKMTKLADSQEFRGDKGQTAAFMDILDAVKRQKLGTGDVDTKHVAILKALDEVKGVRPGNEVDPRQYLGSSYVSGKMPALGGVHTISVLDKVGLTPRLTNVVGDKHDIFGSNFLNPQLDMSVVIPPQSRMLGKENASTLAKRNKYLNRNEWDGVSGIDESVKQMELLSGIPKLPNESAQDYQLRAIAYFKGRPEMQDYLKSAKNLGMLGYMGSDWRQQMEAGQ